jgi:hypothetical protein
LSASRTVTLTAFTAWNWPLRSSRSIRLAETARVWMSFSSMPSFLSASAISPIFSAFAELASLAPYAHVSIPA